VEAVRVNPAQAAEARRRVEDLSLRLPGATFTGEPHAAIAVRGKTFAWFVVDHHGDGRVALHMKAPPGVNGELAGGFPERFFIPPYVGPRGWVGVFLDDGEVDWEAVAGLLADAYRMTAPKILSRQLEQSSHN
jgi:hypothetical protein